MRVNTGNRTLTNKIIGGKSLTIATISSSEAPSGKLFGRFSAEENP